MNIVTLLLSKTIANKHVRIDGNVQGLEILHDALTHLQKRLDDTEGDYLEQEAGVMRESIGQVLELAYSNFQEFSRRWSCMVHYYESPSQSNMFVFNFEEKTDNGRTLNFRFLGLKGAASF